MDRNITMNQFKMQILCLFVFYFPWLCYASTSNAMLKMASP